MIDLDALGFVGAGLRRPECAIAHGSGLVFAPGRIALAVGGLDEAAPGRLFGDRLPMFRSPVPGLGALLRFLDRKGPT